VFFIESALEEDNRHHGEQDDDGAQYAAERDGHLLGVKSAEVASF